MTAKTALGRIAPERIRLRELPPIAASVIERFNHLSDLCGTISDVSDSLGIVCVVPASQLQPVAGARRIVGPALTMRNIARSAQTYKAVVDASNTMGEMEAHNLAKPGDVLVVEGVSSSSNMGGQSASIGKRQGEIGAIIDGTVRDPDQYEKLGWPVWCRGFTPVTGKWRLETVEINGIVQIAGIQCNPGDLVCADRAGVCIIPRSHIEAVLDLCEKFDRADTARQTDIDAGISLQDLAHKKYK